MTSRKSSLLAAALILIPMAIVTANSGSLVLAGPGAYGVTEEGNVTFGFDILYLETKEGKSRFSSAALEIWATQALMPHPKGAQFSPEDGLTRYMVEVVIPDDHRAEETRQRVLAILSTHM